MLFKENISKIFSIIHSDILHKITTYTFLCKTPVSGFAVKWIRVIWKIWWNIPQVENFAQLLSNNKNKQKLQSYNFVFLNIFGVNTLHYKWPKALKSLIFSFIIPYHLSWNTRFLTVNTHILNENCDGCGKVTKNKNHSISITEP